MTPKFVFEGKPYSVLTAPDLNSAVVLAQNYSDEWRSRGLLGVEVPGLTLELAASNKDALKSAGFTRVMVRAFPMEFSLDEAACSPFFLAKNPSADQLNDWAEIAVTSGLRRPELNIQESEVQGDLAQLKAVMRPDCSAAVLEGSTLTGFVVTPKLPVHRGETSPLVAFVWISTAVRENRDKVRNFLVRHILKQADPDKGILGSIHLTNRESLGFARRLGAEPICLLKPPPSP